MLGMIVCVFFLVLISASILSEPTTGWDRSAVVAMWLCASVGGMRGGWGEAVITGIVGALGVGAAWLFWGALLSAIAAW